MFQYSQNVQGHIRKSSSSLQPRGLLQDSSKNHPTRFRVLSRQRRVRVTLRVLNATAFLVAGTPRSLGICRDRTDRRGTPLFAPGVAREGRENEQLGSGRVRRQVKVVEGPERPPERHECAGFQKPLEAKAASGVWCFVVVGGHHPRRATSVHWSSIVDACGAIASNEVHGRSER